MQTIHQLFIKFISNHYFCIINLHNFIWIFEFITYFNYKFFDIFKHLKLIYDYKKL